MGIIIRQRPRAWFIVVFVMLGVVGCMALLRFDNPVKADGSPTDWAWTNPWPVVAESTPVDDIAGEYCNGSYVSKDIVGLGNQWVCVKHADGAQVGTSMINRVFCTVVSFPYGTHMYQVYGTGTCEQRGGCIYIPQSDTFVTEQYMVNNMVRSLVVYEHFTDRLNRVTDDSGSTTGYTFDASNPDFVFKSGDGYAWPVEGIGVSENGEWLAVEFLNRGIGVLNMDTYEMKRVTTLGPTHWQGNEPSIELAVTNNGQHVAMTGVNYGDVTLFDVVPSCGDIANDRNMEFVIPVSVVCRKIGYDKDAFIDRFFAAFNPRFDAQGGELNFFAKSYTGSSRAVTLYAGGYDPQRLDYLALGDSFTSGEGETDDRYYQSFTNDEYEKCHLSTRSYPYLIATSLGIEPQYVRSVACSGAMTGDIVGDEEGYFGQDDRLKNPKYRLDDITKTVYQQSALDNFNPGRTHQIEFVRRYKPKVITVGIGGNDVGFMEKLRSCVGLDTCEWAATSEGREKTAFEVQAAFDTLVQTYTDIHNASPASKIYVIGYPKVIDPKGQCSAVDGLLLNTDEREFMNQGIMYINDVIASAARRAGVDYIDTQESFGNRVLCGSEKPSMMNTLTLGDDIAPLKKAGWLKLIGSESFHPRPGGFSALADTIKRSVPDIRTYDYCQPTLARVTVVCPDNTAVAPWPSNYWLVDGLTHHYATQRLGQFISDASQTNDPKQQSISFATRSFQPNSQISVEVHSIPTLLGSFTVDTSGSARFSVTLPSNLPEGFHTIHVYGTSYSGESVDIYQVIKYQDSTANQTVEPHQGTVDNNPSNSSTTGPSSTPKTDSAVDLSGSATSINDYSDQTASNKPQPETIGTANNDSTVLQSTDTDSGPAVLGQTTDINESDESPVSSVWAVVTGISLVIIGAVTRKVFGRKH